MKNVGGLAAAAALRAAGRRSRNAPRAIAATSRLPTPNSMLLPFMPSRGIAKYPVASTPTTAPRMLTPYSTLVRLPMERSDATSPSSSNGSVPPMKKVGNRNSRNSKRKRTRKTAASLPLARSYSEPYADSTAAKSHGKPSANTPIATSNQP